MEANCGNCKHWEAYRFRGDAYVDMGSCSLHNDPLLTPLDIYSETSGAIAIDTPIDFYCNRHETT